MRYLETEHERPLSIQNVWALTSIVAGLLLVAALQMGVAAQSQSPRKAGLDIALTSKPNPPKLGSNTLEVTVKDASGKPVTDADVTVLFYMAAMPAMKMPEMRTTATLKHQKDGHYAGNGQVAMAGKWDVTVTVKRSGKEIGSKQFPVTAQ